MTDLFSNQAKKSDYTAADIEVLEGLEPVRHRPGMYIGGTDNNALHHLVTEVLDNSMDEAVAGYASAIYVRFLGNNTLQIEDNGRGIPVDLHPKFPDKSALEVILTTLHSGGKFKQGAYKTSGGLHGVGISVVNALCESVIVTVYREGIKYTQSFSKGHVSGPIETEEAPNKRKKGTTIQFKPDPEIFGAKNHFHPSKILEMLKSKAYLFKGVTIHWVCQDESEITDTVPAKTTFHFPNGIKDYLDAYLEGKEVLAAFGGETSNEDVSIEWALAWPEQEETFFKSYCNTIHTPLGGTHENGFRNGFLKSIRTFGERSHTKKVEKIILEDIFSGCVGVISVFIKDPQFQGQTKEKLVSSHVQRPLENLVKDFFEQQFLIHKDTAEVLLNHFILKAEERLLKKQKKDIERSLTIKKVRLPGKLTDCSRSTSDGTEIFIVEGDSAGGSAKQARFRETQAILPLRGKILNVATATMDKMLANQEIKNLTQALGCGYGKACDPSALRYERVIIMTDADVDGAHIASLLMTFFYQQMAPIIEQGRLFLALPPLYKLSAGAKTAYARDDKHKAELLKTSFKKFQKVEVGRFKGLGEMNPKQLKETTMDPDSRSLIRVVIPEGTSPAEFVEKLMGRRVEERLALIQASDSFNIDLDV